MEDRLRHVLILLQEVEEILRQCILSSKNTRWEFLIQKAHPTVKTLVQMLERKLTS